MNGLKMGFNERRKINLLTFSEEKNDFETATLEWFYNGDCWDNGNANSYCELCGHQGIRYEYAIQNSLNGKRLILGSECILRFNIPGRDKDGNVFTADELARKLKADKKSASNFSRVFNLLMILKGYNRIPKISTFFEGYWKYGSFTPKQIYYLFEEFDLCRIPFSARDFNVIDNKGILRDQLKGMKTKQLNRVLPALSDEQLKWYDKNFS